MWTDQAEMPGEAIRPMKEPSELRRFGVSMEDDLLAAFDRLIARKGYQTRSEALRDMARTAIAEEVLTDEAAEAVATVSLVYNHHVPNLTAKLTEVQHHALDLISSTLHIHLDEDRCLEVLVLRGPFGRVRELAENLISVKGVKYGKFMTTTGAAEARRGPSSTPTSRASKKHRGTAKIPAHRHI
jgi:CopG family nickel-responsive transcriptional regulator